MSNTSQTIEKYFEKFLEGKVNLNSTRVERIKEAERILTEFISSIEDYKEIYIDIKPQGSYRQKTIIKPTGADGQFDVDLMISLQENNWEPSEYLSKLADALKESKRYEDITETRGKTRCVTIDYEGDFHVDLVPAVKDLNGNYKICNKRDNSFELSDGDGYAEWFRTQNLSANGYLVPTVRLLKYLRDKQNEFDTKSIILTTLAGMCVPEKKTFDNLPEAFASIVKCMNGYLSAYNVPPSIPNPAMPGETFDRHWKDDDKGFLKLKSAIQKYSEHAEKAISCSDESEQIKHWKNIFGQDFSAERNTKQDNSNVHQQKISRNTKPFTPSNPWSECYD